MFKNVFLKPSMISYY